MGWIGMGLGYVQCAFTDYSELCQVLLNCKTKVIKLGHVWWIYEVDQLFPFIVVHFIKIQRFQTRNILTGFFASIFSGNNL